MYVCTNMDSAFFNITHIYFMQQKKDINGQRALELLPQEIKSRTAYIEVKLRLSGVKYIPKLKDTDDRSSRTERGFSDANDENEQNVPQNSAENDGFHTSDGIKEDEMLSILGYNREDDDGEDGDNDDQEMTEFQRDGTYEDDEYDASSAKNSFSVSTAHFTHDTDNLFVDNLKESHSIQTAQALKEELNSIQSVFNLTEERILEVTNNLQFFFELFFQMVLQCII